MELLLGLVAMVCLVGVLAVIGHGIWLLVAAVLGAMFGSSTPPPQPSRGRRRRYTCPGCRTELQTGDRSCPRCHLPFNGRLAARLARLRGAEQEVLALVENSDLDSAVAQQVVRRLDQLARDLLEGRDDPHAPSRAIPRVEHEPLDPVLEGRDDPHARPQAVPVSPPIPRARPVVSAAMTLGEPFVPLGPSEGEPDATPPPTPLPPPPTEPILDAVPAVEPREQPRHGMLAAFMEERNILWGELVGGLLIVGCSIALVLTLWRSLEALPYFPFLLATGITAALYGAGQYTLHHWKLAATSRGLLIISLLLTPLNLLLLAGPGSDAAGGWLDVGVKVVAVLLFTGMVRGAGRDLIGTHLLPGPIDRRWLLALAVVGAPASQVLPAGWTGGTGSSLSPWLALLCHTVACGAALGGLTWYRPRAERTALLGRQGAAILTFVGISLFALFAAWGLVLTVSPDRMAAVAGLAFPLALAAVPVAEVGILVQRRSPGDAWLKAIGTGVTLVGSILLLGGLTVAWPDPVQLLLVTTLAGVLFSRVAWRESQPWFHLGAIPALGLAAVLGVHGIVGDWAVPADMAPGSWLRGMLDSAISGVVLTGFGLVLAALAEGIIRTGNRAQAVAYALGGATAGTFALFLVNVHGVEAPWLAVAVHAGCAIGLLVANVRWRRRILAEAGGWLVLVGTLWTLWAVARDDRVVWGLVVALESLILSAIALALTPRAARPGVGGVMFGQLRLATANVATAAGVMAVALTLFTSAFPRGWISATPFLVLVPAGLLLARVFAKPWPTWAGSTAAVLGLALLNVYSLAVKPVSAALLLALLGQTTLALAGAWLLRGRRSRNRLFADPLRQSAMIVSVLVVAFLLVPSPGLALVWAGFALWLAVVWFALAWVWRETGAFSAAHGALTLVGVLCGVSWAERQEWWGTSALGGADPRTLQAIGVALAGLGLAWVVARRAAVRNERLNTLWLHEPFSIDQIVTGFVVVSQLILLCLAIEPAVRAELIPTGQTLWPWPPVEVATAFGPGTWLVLGLLAVGLVARLRLATDDEPGGDAPLLGLAILLVSVAVVVAGSFGPELAAASALRWGLASAFLAGSSVLFFREPLARWVATAGFRLRATLWSTHGSYALFAVAAGVVLLLTANLTVLGLNRTKPSGPADGSVFASMGYTASFIVPLVLLIVGLTGSAVRERLAGYAFAAGLVFTGTMTSGYALMVITGGGSIDVMMMFRLEMLAVGSAAVWTLLWLASERRVPGGQLLDVQATFGLIGVGALILGPLGGMLLFPTAPLSPDFAEIGRFGWVVIALAGWAGFERANRSNPAMREHVVGFLAVVVGVVAGCAVQPWDEAGASASFLTMATTWAVAGLGLTAALFAAPVVARGPWVGVLAVAVTLAALIGPIPAVGRWPLPVALAGDVLLAAGIVAALARRTTSTHREPAVWGWVTLSQIAIAAVALLLAVLTTIDHVNLLERLAGPFAVLLVAVGVGLLAGVAPAGLSGQLRLGAVAVAAGGIGLVGWAVPSADEPVVWLQRNSWAFVALVGAGVACLDVVPRVRPGSLWAADARRVVGSLALAALIALVVVLVQQVPVFDPVTKRTPLELPAVLSVLGGIAVLIGLALRAAVRPLADPLDLPEARRTAYVYLAEVLLVLFFVHIRLNIPELFFGQAVRYWTFIVMLLAFVGIGLAELFERRGVMVFAGPLRRTGVLLPLIPLLAFWAKPSGAVMAFADNQAPGLRPLLGYLEKLPQHFDSYAGLWLLAGLLYGLVALSRQSFGWALLGALATNAGIWALLTHNGVSATIHPQVWVIPLALIVLVSEHINRRELRAEVSASLRYLGIGMLYVSSAADMFIAGVGESLWLPVILAALCVVGVITGIVLRVRAFLFLGTGFLLLDVFAMIWHAAVDRDQTWVWYVSGIVLGAAILALFALFEKRRNDLLSVVDRIRQWD